MENIIETVYNTLEMYTDEIRKAIDERDRLEEKIKAGRYSPQALKNEIYAKRDSLQQRVDSLCDTAMNDARSHIDKYKADMDALNILDPSKLTDDVKLLQSGITLLPRDIQGILNRNKDNRTMTQIILRYAEEHDIDIGNALYVGGQQEQQTAKNLEEILSYYKNWIDKPDAKYMLNRFFNR